METFGHKVSNYYKTDLIIYCLFTLLIMGLRRKLLVGWGWSYLTIFLWGWTEKSTLYVVVCVGRYLLILLLNLTCFITHWNRKSNYQQFSYQNSSNFFTYSRPEINWPVKYVITKLIKIIPIRKIRNETHFSWLDTVWFGLPSKIIKSLYSIQWLSHLKEI